jgi:hypothetical protein
MHIMIAEKDRDDMVLHPVGVAEAAVHLGISTLLQAANKVFDDDRLTLEAKLLKALDEWFGRHAALRSPFDMASHTAGLSPRP